jgi:hypothetical protein
VWQAAIAAWSWYRPGLRRLDQRAALLDLRLVPPRAVLIFEQDDRALVVEPRPSPRVVQEHQGEETERLRFVGHQAGQRPAEPDRLGAELVADVGVACVEDQIHGGEDRLEPLGKGVVRRDSERDPGRADLVLRPDEPLRHRRLAGQEGAGDLGRGQAAEQPERERHLRVDRQRRVTAREDQREPLVGDRAHVVVLLIRGEFGQPGQLGPFCLKRPLTAEPVDRPVAGGGDDPRARAGRDSVAWPAFRRHGEGLLNGVLGEVEVAERADQDRYRAPELLPERLCDGVGGHSSQTTTGRTSIVP